MSNQTICQNCKAVLEEGALFCPVCGTKKEIPDPTPAPAKKTVFCTSCGAQADAELSFCQECGKPLTKNEVAASSNIGNETKKKANKINEIFKKPLYIAIPATVLVLIVLIAFVMTMKPSRSSHLIFAKDKELQFSHLSNQKTFELTDRLTTDSGYFDADDFMGLSRYIYISDDERYIYYPDRYDGNEVTYYWRDLKADNSKSGSNIKIDSEIRSYPFLSADGNKFFYIKGNDNRLYVFDRKSDEKIKLDDEVTSFYVSDSGDYIIYNKYIDDEYSIYEMSMKGTTGEKNKLDSDSRIRAAFANEKKVFYIKDDSLYLMESGQNKTKISSEIDSIVSIVDKDSVYYLKREEIVNKLSNYINDDMIAEDRDISDELPSPSYTEEPLYPSESDYTIETWVDSIWGYSRHPETNEWGYWDYTVDETAYWSAIEEYENRHSAWEAAVERYNAEYEEAYQKLRGKEYRDELRNAFDSEENSITYNEYSLYYWSKGSETLVASDVNSYPLSSSSLVSAVVYQRNNMSSINTQKLSEMITNDNNYYSLYDYIYDLQEKIRASRNLSDDIYLAIGEKETTIDCINARNWSINKAGSIYYLDDYNDEKGYGTLMSAVVKNGVIENPVKIDDDVMSFQFGNANDNILYYKDVKKGSGDVYMNNKLIASDVYIDSLYNYEGSDKLLYYIDYSEKSQSGTLCLYDGKAETKIADDVSFFSPINDTNIAYLMDYRYDREKGDLMLYNGKKKPTPIDTDVTALLWNPKMIWGSYWYYFY